MQTYAKREKHKELFNILRFKILSQKELNKQKEVNKLESQ